MANRILAKFPLKNVRFPVIVLLVTLTLWLFIAHDKDNQKRTSTAQGRRSRRPPPPNLRHLNLAAHATTLDNLQKQVIPQVSCPNKRRMGPKTGDGGKWVCNPMEVPSDCVVYSFGVNKDTNFERDMYETGGRRCRIICVDPGSENPETFKPFNGTFVQSSLHGQADKAKNQTSILELMEKFGHSKVDILKMDIEQWEFEALDGFFNATDISDESSSICQFMAEFHPWGLGSDPKAWLHALEQLERKGFMMFSSEAAVWPGCYEYSFIHLSCFRQYGLKEDSVNVTFF